MFNTLVYIPTILAYTFISLLVVILGFIVIYVTHKIYTTIYDNLPVAQLSSKSSIVEQFTPTAQQGSLLDFGIKADGQVASSRKSKTALRIMVNMEQCYLAFMVFESLLKPSLIYSPYTHRLSHSFTSTSSTEDTAASNIHLLVKYFDTLASIPTKQDLKTCDNFNSLYNYKYKMFFNNEIKNYN